MQDKINYIESLYYNQLLGLNNQITQLNNWRTQALNSLKKEDSLPIPPPLLPKEIHGMAFKGSKESLIELYKFFIEKDFLEEVSEEFFYRHFDKATLIMIPINIKIFTKKLVWIFYILQLINQITNTSIHVFLPQHFLNKRKKSLNPDTLETYLTEIRRSCEKKNLPDYIIDLLMIFPSKSLPKSLQNQ